MKFPLVCALCAMASASTSAGATVSLVAEGVISQAWIGGYLSAETGDGFRLSVTYSDTWEDNNPDAEIGVYFAEDLSVALEILGKGVAFSSIGGSVNVSLRPGDFPAISISSTLPDGNWFLIHFRDDDRSSIGAASLPTDFGTITDYDWVGFAVIDLPAMLPDTPNPLEGTVSSLAIPEPGAICLVGLAALLAGFRRSRSGG